MVENISEVRQLVVDGLTYMNGTGEKRNEAAAFDCFWRAARQKDPVGEFMVGVCYDRGWGTTQNAYEAFRWYELAAEHGLPEAQFNLGVCFQRGEGTMENMSRAIAEYDRAREQGLPEAWYNYAVCTEFGIGVEQNKKSAQETYTAIAAYFPMAANRVEKKEIREGLLGMFIGLLIVVVGVVISWISYECASGGGSYTVFTGLIVIGGFSFFSGLYTLLKGISHSATSVVSKDPDPNQILAGRLDRLTTVDLFGEDLEEDADEWTFIDYSKVRNLSVDVLATALPNAPFVLDLSCSGITDEVLEYLRGNVNLRSIDLIGCPNVTPTGLRYLCECPKLSILSVGSNPTVNPQSGMVTFKDFKNVDDSWLEVISGMSQLTVLRIMGCSRITDEGTAQLERLTRLRNMTLTSCKKITDRGYGFLRSMLRLRSVEIGSPKMTGKVLSYLEGAIQLKSIVLYDPVKIDDEDVAQLAQLPMLQEFECQFCLRISKHRVKKWNKMLPKCQVEFGPLTGTKVSFDVRNVGTWLVIILVALMILIIIANLS